MVSTVVKHFDSYPCRAIWLLWVFLIVRRYHDVSTSSLVIEPQVGRFLLRGNMTAICKSDLPLIQCQFRLYSWRTGYPLIDLSQGRSSLSVTAKGSNRRLRYEAQYAGTGLENGQCGILLTNIYYGRWLVVCRARAEKGDWQQAYMTGQSINTSVDKTEISIEPRDPVVLPGKDVSVICKSSSPLTSCTMDLPSEGSEVFFNQGAQSPSNSHYRYAGTSLDQGQCGATVLKVTEKDNGPVWCWANQVGSRATILTVASPPSDPELVLSTGSSYYAGDTLKAACTVRDSRPAARITWFLGESIISSEHVSDIPTDTWTWPWDEKTVVQSVQVKVEQEHNGKALTCRVEHVALQQSKQVKMVITVAGGSIKVVPELDCGRQSGITLLISGGKDASLGEFPWHGGLYRLIDNKYKMQCSCTLVSTRLAITAAHCVYDENKEKVVDKSMYRLAFGKLEIDWDVDINNWNIQRRNLSQVIMPTRYTGRQFNYQYDIAVLVLDSDVLLTDSVGIICIDWNNGFEKKQLVPGKEGIATGWGITETGRQSNVLQWLKLPYVSDDTCLTAIRKLQPQASIFFTWDKLCAGVLNKKKGVCKGDSGGPLIFLNETTNRYYLRGIVSVGFAPNPLGEKCSTHLYTGFTSLSYYTGWIKEEVLSKVV